MGGCIDFRYLSEKHLQVERYIYPQYTFIPIMGRKKRIESGTHIRIDIKTRDVLKGIGKKGETYNDIIRMLVKKAGFYLPVKRKEVEREGRTSMEETILAIEHYEHGKTDKVEKAL